MRKLILFIVASMLTLGVQAQRMTDKLDRGLVAMKAGTGVYLSWRIQADEYYDVTYNVYRDGTPVAQNLSVSNYSDPSGSLTSTYQVAAVVRGVEQGLSTAAKPWSSSYKEIQLKHEGIKSKLTPNDACCADVDGDGELEILMKFDNQSEIDQSFPKNGPKINGVDTKEYSIMEVLKLDGTRLWWVNCGPNMGDFQNNEQNIVAYDWDEDGRAEVIMRACDGTTIHMADGTTYTVGNASANVRGATGGGANWFVITTGEYLLYLDGQTGQVHQCLPYPLRLLESGESDVNKAWGDGYGHRASKHFFGAPYFDGRKPSIFIARGIYTRHKMIAYDVDPATHTLTERWRWFNNTNGPWKGQGYHNYCVADVDLDGRDEIVFGSMVIDDNGKGLSTTGFGHGDAEQVGDLNPYHHGQEVFACMEDNPGTNYRDATTSKVFFRYVAGRDVGRCMAGNFSNTYPGGICTPTGGKPLSTVTGAINNSLVEEGINQNFRIYWDGDLCEETFNYVNGKNTEGCIAKYGSWSPIYTCTGSQTNNDTKGTPCYQGDILGDWREEIIMRTATGNIRIYSTATPTQWRIPSLWYDHQYRNAMVWQMCGYNQPPRPSYFLGELEGITIAPPPLTMTGRTEVSDGGTIGASLNGQHVIVCETNNSTVTIAAGAQPEVLTFNVPTWVQGTAPSESTNQNTKINYTTYTCTVNGAGISGTGRLVKQGDGILALPKTDFTHTGETNVWGGTLKFDGTMKQSLLWLNRHTELLSDGGQFLSVRADYGSVIRPGDADHQGIVTIDTLSLGFGSRVSFDLYSATKQADVVKAKVLKIERKTGSVWTQQGPDYLMPVIELKGHLAEGETKMGSGKYVIAEVGDIEGDVADLIIEGLATQKRQLLVEDGKLILEIVGMRDPGTIRWTGSESNKWDVGETANFVIGAEAEPTTFVSEDIVTFTDDATTKGVSVTTDVYPNSVLVSTTGNYTFSGAGAISGTASLIKEGTGTLTINNEHSYTGGTSLLGGTTKVKKLANQYSATGNLGGVTTKASLFTIGNGATLMTTAAVEQGSPMQMTGDEGGIINNQADFVAAKAISGTMLTKKGGGWLKLTANNSSLTRLVIAGGTVQCQGIGTPAKTVEFQGGTLNEGASSSYAIDVPEGKTGTWYMANRCTYSNKVTGKGTLNAYCVTEKGTNYYATRTPVQCNLSEFEGTLKPSSSLDDPSCLRFTLNTSTGMPKGTMNIAATVEVQNSGKAFRIGKVTGSGKLGGSCTFSNGSSVGANTWQVGNDEDWATSVKVTSNANFVKVGHGRITWNSVNDNTGATTVSEGELKLGANAQLGTGKLTVSQGAVLVFSSKPKALNNSAYAINGTILIELNAGHTLQVGDSIRLWNAKTLTGNPTVEGTDGIEWDASRLSEGLVFVKSINTGVRTVEISESHPVDIYDLRGQLVRQQASSVRGLKPGVYVVEGRKIVVR